MNRTLDRRLAAREQAPPRGTRRARDMTDGALLQLFDQDLIGTPKGMMPFREAIAGHICGPPWFDRGNLGPRASVCRVPAFSITAACPCGAEITFEAVCLPKDG